MSLETFNFPYHVPSISYPEGRKLKFGRGYNYGVKPLLPINRMINLKFNTMRWIENGSGGLDITTDPTKNLGTLLDFYDRHQMYESFNYTCSFTGQIIVKFAAPFQGPEATKGGTGWTESFDIRLEETRA